MPYRESPQVKIFILICRNLIRKGSYLRQGTVFSACVAEDFNEAIYKFGVIDKCLNGFSICPITGHWAKDVEMPADPPKWYDGDHRYWKKFLNKKLLWEVVLVSDSVKNPINLFDSQLWDVKKIKAI